MQDGTAEDSNEGTLLLPLLAPQATPPVRAQRARELAASAAAAPSSAQVPELQALIVVQT
jgi:hypothetical protein